MYASPLCCTSQKLPVSGVQRYPRLMQVEEREASGASTLDAASSVTFRVVAWMPFALRLHPLGDLEFVVELEHDLLLLEKEREPGCGLPLRVRVELAS